ncbi:MAG: hypothetical protein WBR15_04265 [Gammaproteobacteria bacterium]
MTDWNAENVRLTAFFRESNINGKSDWWAELTSTQPKVSVRQPQYQDYGPVEQGILILAMEQSRIDWIYTPDPEKIGDNLFVIGSIGAAVTTFVKLMNRWLSMDVPPLGRIAFGAVMLQSVEDRLAGYKLLSQYLKDIPLDGENSSEFIYQINRPRRLPDGMEINRLSKWSVAKLHRLHVELTSIGKPPVTNVGKQHNACRLEVDISTPAAFSEELRKENYVSVFETLVSMGMEISEKGEIP